MIRESKGKGRPWTFCEGTEEGRGKALPIISVSG
jgi:hypothetical protein